MTGRRDEMKNQKAQEVEGMRRFDGLATEERILEGIPSPGNTLNLPHNKCSNRPNLR